MESELDDGTQAERLGFDRAVGGCVFIRAAGIFTATAPSSTTAHSVSSALQMPAGHALRA
jgi:hypothetical protein